MLRAVANLPLRVPTLPLGFNLKALGLMDHYPAQITTSRIIAARPMSRFRNNRRTFMGAPT
jgi:hypothetical protein